MSAGIPRVFVGSASESLDVVDVIKERLKSTADVIAWNDESVFPPSQYLLETLLGLSRSFDFAILVFGSDDQVISRGERSAAPRDKVVFELGLFMSQLDRPRTFIVRPAGNVKYRILSDLGGFTSLTYEAPPLRKQKGSVSVDEKRKNTLFLESALQKACSGIVAAINHHGKRRAPDPAAQLGPENVLDVGAKLFEQIDAMQSGESKISVGNIAHDMGVTWPLLKARILDQKQIRNLHWRTLMIDPDSAEVKRVAGGGISTRIARSRIREMEWASDDLDRALRDRNVGFECRTYSEIPTFHGFLLNTESLFLTMSKVQRNGKLESSSSPYWVFRRDTENQQLSHPIEAFQSWFDYTWKRAHRVR
jgi:predicted nucleotide-binding protein